MISEINPYSPGAGRRPPELAGRDLEIEKFDRLVAHVRRGVGGRGIVLHGYRGVGKTVLLNRLRQQAERAGWLSVQLEGGTTDAGRISLKRKFARGIFGAITELKRANTITKGLSRAISTVESFSVKFGGVEVSAVPNRAIGRADSGHIEVDLEELITDLAPELMARRIAFGVFVDEMQDLDHELLGALVEVQHRANQEGWPFYLVGAGLPSLPTVLASTKTYAERIFEYHSIDALSPDHAVAALTIPATQYGAKFADGAAELLSDAARGYPYFIQTYGYELWELAQQRLFSMDDARKALHAGNVALDSGFFPSRWHRTTGAERDLMRAMAEDNDNWSKTADLAMRLNRPVAGISPARQSLITKGVIFVPERGHVAFSVPLMAAFIRRQEID